MFDNICRGNLPPILNTFLGEHITPNKAIAMGLYICKECSEAKFVITNQVTAYENTH